MLKIDKCLMNNSKTVKSCDFTTDCPKRRQGKQCKYCYVEASRNIGFNAKKIISSIPYNDDILKMTQPTIDKLNAIGGLRLFSFGDYIREENHDKIYSMLTDCRTKGLKVKVITKVTEFIDDFYTEFEDVFSVIHISIDNIGDGVEHGTALAYRDKYDKVILRSVILNNNDLIALEPISDILTFNHANVKIDGIETINYKLHPKMFNELKDKYANKTCCITGSCSTCKIHCKAK